MTIVNAVSFIALLDYLYFFLIFEMMIYVYLLFRKAYTFLLNIYYFGSMIFCII